MTTAVRAGALAVSVTAIIASGPADLRSPSARNVLVVSLDTTRADHLSPYGFMDVPLPTLDRLARDGVVFDQATSVAPLTLPAHTSLFTGLLPTTHGVRDNSAPPLDASKLTLAEALDERGYRTAAFVASVVLNADRGLAPGFDHYDDVADHREVPRRNQRRAGEVVDAAVTWLDTIRDDRFLAWVHLYDPHLPYDPPPPFRAMANPYLAEIAYMDTELARLLAALERRGSLDDTIVIVVGDHGESLGEFGEADHGIFIYQNVLRVPFILRAPGVVPRRVAEVVRITDVMPTVLALLNIPLPAMDGTSLLPIIRGEARPGLEAYAESLYPRDFGWSPLYALRDGRFKYIEAPRAELYDLERDPFEQRNVLSEHPSVAAAMRARIAALNRVAKATEATEPPADLRQRLQSLGYLSRGTSPPPPDRLPDPKDQIHKRPARHEMPRQ